MSGGGPGKVGQEKDKAIYDMVMELLAQTQPIGETVASQGAEAFATGDIAAMREQIRHAIEASMTAAGQDKIAARDALAQKGLTRTPFGQKALSSVALEGRQRTALVQPQMIQEVLARLIPALTGQSVETAIAGDNNIADAATRNSISQRLGNANALSALIQGTGQLGAAGIQAYYGGGATPPPIKPATAPITPTVQV